MATRLPPAPGSETPRLVVTANNFLGAYEGRLSPERRTVRADALRRSFATVIDGALAALFIGVWESLRVYSGRLGTVNPSGMAGQDQYRLVFWPDAPRERRVLKASPRPSPPAPSD